MKKLEIDWANLIKNPSHSINYQSLSKNYSSNELIHTLLLQMSYEISNKPNSNQESEESITSISNS